MELTFTRGEENNCMSTVLRDDGVLLQVFNGTRTFPLPHDLTHFVVEYALGLKRGFWGRVAAGAVYPGMKVVSGRQQARATERSRAIIREHEQQGVEAEVLVGILYSLVEEDLDHNRSVVCSRLKEAWRSSRPERDLPGVEEVQYACADLREAERKWQSLEAGQSMTVLWPYHRHRRSREAAGGGNIRRR